MKLKYGYSFYPEQCNSYDEVCEEIQLIKQSGANVVRMGEFCWDQLEPEEGQYNFTWLIRVVNELGENGVMSVLCTPTACPPAWLCEKYPEILYVDNRGVTRPFGARHHYCYNNEVYRAYSEKITRKIGECFKNNPYIAGFQLGNEFAQESSGRCHCKICMGKFREYLKIRYGTIQELNKSWGTCFWGQTYNHFDQVNPPIATTEPCSTEKINSFYDNPSLRLAFERFCSDSIKEYLEIQQKTLKPLTDKPITTNSTGFCTNSIDYFQFYKSLDVYGHDSYPDLAGEDLSLASFEYSFARNIQNKNFWMLEFSIGGGHGLWAREGRLQPYPGAIEQAVMHAFASGAELFTHFQFKTFRYGAEQLNYALLDQDKIPRRRYFELQKTAKQLERYESIFVNSKPAKSGVAILMDYDSLWALKIKPVKHEFDYINLCCEFHKKLKQLGSDADIVSFDAKLDDYKLVILPAAFLMGEKEKTCITEFVKQGGVVFATFLTAVKNKENTAIEQSMPCGMTELFGINVYEVEPVFEHSAAVLSMPCGDNALIGKNRFWCEELRLTTAQPVAVFADTFRSGSPVISRNSFCGGTAYYMGTMPDDAMLKSILNRALDESGIQKVPFPIPHGVEVITRTYEDKNIYFLFNYLKTELRIPLNLENYVFTDTLLPCEEVILSAKGYTCITTLGLNS